MRIPTVQGVTGDFFALMGASFGGPTVNQSQTLIAQAYDTADFWRRLDPPSQPLTHSSHDPHVDRAVRDRVSRLGLADFFHERQTESGCASAICAKSLSAESIVRSWRMQSAASRASIVPIVMDQKRQRGEAVNDFVPGFWTGESLKEFLQNNAGREHHLTRLERPAEN
jgi:hypothetical protein